MKKEFIWISRHDLTNGQAAMLPVLGFEGVIKISLLFGDDPVADLHKIGVSPCKIGLVAPLSVGLDLLREGFEIVEFRNKPSARQKGVFLCEGAFVHTLRQSVWHKCPMPLEQQGTGDLSPVK